MVFNISSIKTSSNGIWQGDNPLDYALPLLILQISLILLLTHSLSFLFKPLRQPKVIAEIIGGILLGPSALGRNQTYMHLIFPSWSTPLLESLATIGLLFFLFLVALELDLTSLRRTRRRAAAVAAAGISLPFILGAAVAVLLRKTVAGADRVGFAPFVVFVGVALSVTAFPVLARILAELNLLTTNLGELAMAAAAINDVAAWILLALAVAISGEGGRHRSPLVSVWVLLSGVGFVIFMLFVTRPGMKWVARKYYSGQEEVCTCLTLMGVMVSGFMTDLIGIHSIFGAFVFGLTIPRGDFAERLVVRIEDFVSGLLLPLYFASSGLKTNVGKIRGGEAWGLLALVITAASAGKILGTLAAAMICWMPAREALTLGFLMNTKGLVELIVLNIGREKKVLNEEMFAILVLMALFTTFMTTPAVMSIYKPARVISAATTHRSLADFSSSTSTNKKLGVLACVYGPSNIPSIITTTNINVSIIHLAERSTAQRCRKNGLPLGGFQATSSLSTMHEEICHVAVKKRVSLIILPFHKQWRVGMEEDLGDGWRGVNQRVLHNSPCSVAVFVDRGGYGNNNVSASGANTNVAQRVCVLFFGGPHDREALEFGSVMAENTAVKVTVVRFLDTNGLSGDGVLLRPSPNNCTENNYSSSTATMNREKEQGMDEKAVEEFRRKWERAIYEEKEGSNVVEEVMGIGRSGEYDLIVVGKGQFPSSMVAEMAENTELGPIGDILASSGKGVVSSVLVIQQHDVELADEAPMCKGNSTSNDNNV